MLVIYVSAIFYFLEAKIFRLTSAVYAKFLQTCKRFIFRKDENYDLFAVISFYVKQKFGRKKFFIPLNSN